MLDTEEPYLHLVHPRPVSWTVIISIFSWRLGLPIVSLGDWLVALQRSRPNIEHKEGSSVSNKEKVKIMLRQNPAINLVGFFAQLHRDQQNGLRDPEHQTVSCEKAIAASWTLRDPSLPQIGESDVVGWIRNWEKIGFLGPRTRAKSLL